MALHNIRPHRYAEHKMRSIAVDMAWSVSVCVCLYVCLCVCLTQPWAMLQEAQLSPSDRAMRLVSSNLANYHATVQKLLIRQVLTKQMI